MPTSEAQKRASRKWDKEHLHRFTLAMTKEGHEKAKILAEAQGKTVNRYICDLIETEADKAGI